MNCGHTAGNGSLTNGGDPTVMTGPVAPTSTRISIAGRATSVPFTTALNGPEQTTTDNHEAASTCDVPHPRR
jgi:hypothetical protein